MNKVLERLERLKTRLDESPLSGPPPPATGKSGANATSGRIAATARRGAGGRGLEVVERYADGTAKDELTRLHERVDMERFFADDGYAADPRRLRDAQRISALEYEAQQNARPPAIPATAPLEERARGSQAAWEKERDSVLRREHNTRIDERIAELMREKRSEPEETAE